MSAITIRDFFAVSTRERLFKNAKGLNEKFDCINHHDALEQKGRDVYNIDFPLDLYRNGVHKRLEDMVDATTPKVHVVMLDYARSGLDASYAGLEFAKRLRVLREDVTVLRVYARNPKEKPAESILLQLLASLIWNMINLVPDSFRPVRDLRKRNFEAFMTREPGCFEMGMRLLTALPRLDTKGRKLIFIVDGLEHAESEKTLDQVGDLVRTLRDIVASNCGQLLFTLNKKSEIITE
ncbi:hypothetical protein F4821DRAFT_264690 [Hypoxylon rubiginosum]|uniref:Uncharacterized protein n=1 Tax=Hypoxylon rubiginosum TaxID=110542 RepID=A0ACC0CMP5_9PEZI|nr:hypothetical protein F4821DRAFT_264690 [Hypoxylon rubiginosum]